MQATIEIKKPCHETLEDRKPGEQGNYCKACQRTVIDFTRKTPEEISHYFMTQGVHCGTFNRKDVSTGSRADQLILYLKNRKLKFLAFMVLMLTILVSCRTRLRGAPAYGGGPIRPLDHTTQSIENLK